MFAYLFLPVQNESARNFR